MRPMRILLLAAITLFLSAFAWIHPYHVSVTEIKHNAKENLVEISCKVFSEDIEEAVKKINSVSIDISAKKDSARVFTLLDNYFKTHLTITLDGTKATPKFLGFEKLEDAIWCYFESADIKSIKKVCIENTILYEYIPEQTNMMHLVTSEGRKSTKLNNPDVRACFE
jgi:hypothetical protein